MFVSLTVLHSITSRNLRKSNLARSKGGNGGPKQPPVLRTTVRGSHTFRWVFSVGSTTPVTLLGSDISSFLVSKVSGSTTTTRILSATRLRKAEMWYQYNSQGSGGSAPSLNSHQPGFVVPAENTGVIDNPEETKSSVVLGTAQAGHVVIRPQKGTVMAGWHDSASSATILTIDTAGAEWAGVVDITIDFCMSDAQHPAGTFVGASGSNTSLGQASFTGLNPVGYQIQ
jgi:hypothetical protein